MTDLPQLFSDLVRLEIELFEGVDARLRRDVDLPMTSFEPMQVIARTPSCRVQDIARQLAITVGGASKCVDRIEAAGHCARRANPGDRRSSIVELTGSGAALLREATVSFEDELQRRLGAAVPAAALDALATTIAALRAASPERTP
jgi:DNA-binding MarR family transcriptional regulator